MNTTLGKEENIISEVNFSPNLALFWLKADYMLTNRRLNGKRPNTLAGIIPLGKVDISQPLKTVASVACVTKFWFKRLIAGLILLMIGMVLMAEVSFFTGLISVLAGVAFVLTCYTAYFEVLNNAGQHIGCEVIITAQGEVQAFANRINEVISEI